MKTKLALIFLFCNPFLNWAQDNYFQQELNYQIDVVLNDSSNILNGHIQIEYINHSPDILDKIYFHLWANAFNDKNSAFSKQRIYQGDSEFYFAQEEDLGGYSNLDFKINHSPANWDFDEQHSDIAIIKLDTALNPGEKLLISTPFELKIPKVFSRMGYEDSIFHLTQWYPKPAVYDKKGWHPMPYLDLGEFYSEFGKFEVAITLPQEYQVAATGVLAEEIKKPAGKKCLKFIAAQVHDFALFAGMDFQVVEKKHALPSGKIIPIKVYYSQKDAAVWEQAPGYAAQAVDFYSEQIGEYPYPALSIVQGSLVAGSGMEYPMITVIAESDSEEILDLVIAHEVGHNWFYGILAFNERDFAWMDEGINSFYEQRYMDRYHQEDSEFSYDLLTRGTNMDVVEAVYVHKARQKEDLSVKPVSEDSKLLDYWLTAYEFPAKAFRFLENYLGTEDFDLILQSFFEAWAFRHPQPEDLQHHFEKASGKKLDWFFKGIIEANLPVDYSINSIRKEEEKNIISIQNKGELAVPFRLSFFNKEDLIKKSDWLQGFLGEKSIIVEAKGFDRISLDAERLLPDINRKNNHIKLGGLSKKLEKLKLRALTGLENDERTDLFWLPLVAWNQYDKMMYGFSLHNKAVPIKRFEFSISPFYAHGSSSLTGFADLHWHIFPQSDVVKSITLGVDARSFHFNYISRFDYDLQYRRIVPFLRFYFKGNSPDTDYSLQFRSILLNTEAGTFDMAGNYSGKEWQNQFIHEMSFGWENKNILHSSELNLSLEYQKYDYFDDRENYLKASLEWENTFAYQPDKNVDIRLFAGGFLQNSKREGGALFPGAFNLISQGANDYRFDHLQVARNDYEDIWSQQVIISDGGFKSPIGRGHPLGRSNDYILALNLKANLPFDLPLGLPLKAYFDTGYFHNAMPTGMDDAFEDQFLWSGGLMLGFFKDAVGVYFPLAQSENIDNLLREKGNYWSRISFSIGFGKLNPVGLRKQI